MARRRSAAPAAGERGVSAEGDFRVIRLDGLFHVVFRPDSDPEWFRIIASFYTYERAYQYCDVERCMTLDDFSDTHDEEAAGLRLPPVGANLDAARNEADIPGLVRDIWNIGDKVTPHPRDDFSDQPEHDEAPKDYHRRRDETAKAEAAKEIARAADRLGDTADLPDSVVSQLSKNGQAQVREARAKAMAPDGEPLTERQLAVYDFFTEHANPLHLVEASIKDISDGAGVPHGSMGFLLETLEKKKLIEDAERGGPMRKGVYRVNAMAAQPCLPGAPA